MGEKERFRMIVQAHQQRTYRAALRVLNDRDEALDAAQDAFLALYRNRASVREGATASWLVRVATNRALDRVRRRGRVRPLDVEAGGGGEDPASAASRAEDRTRVMEALAALSDRQRQVVTMRVLEQMSFVEIRAALEISEGAAKVHFRRGLEALRRRLVAAGS